MPHARGEKSSAWNGRAATNQTPNPSQYGLVSFHLISQAIRPLQPTPSSSLFSKIKDKTTPKGRVHFHHDTWPLKTRLVTLPPLQTKPHLGTTPSLVISNFWFEPRLPSSRFDKRALSQSPNQIRTGNVYKFKTNVVAQLISISELKRRNVAPKKHPFDFSTCLETTNDLFYNFTFPYSALSSNK